MENTVIRQCQCCNEITPQVDNNTTGYSCQVCLESNNYEGVAAVAAEISSEWLASFWQRKYWELRHGSTFIPFGPPAVAVTINQHPHKLTAEWTQ